MIGNKVPVRDHDSFKAQLVTKEVRNDGLVECKGYWGVLSANRSGVIRHDLACAGGNSSFERNQVMLEVVARVCLILAPAALMFRQRSSSQMFQTGSSQSVLTT